MNWDAIGAVAELGGAIAVVVTLVYLSTQLRQHAMQMRNEGHRDVIESYNMYLRNIIDNKAYPFLVTAAVDWHGLSVEEKADANLLYNQQLNHYRLAFKLFQKGAIDEDIYSIYEDLHIRVFANPGLQEWLKET